MRILLLSALMILAATPTTHAQRSRSPRPIPNSEFLGVKTSGKVTPIFEIYDPHSREELEHVRNMGFDQVILDRAPLHKDATDLGLKVVLANWWTPETKPDQIDSMFDLAQQVAPGMLAGISIMDEPERNSPDTPFGFYVDLYKKLKPRMVGPLKDVGLEISYWGPLVSWDQRYYDYFSYLYEAADLMRLMPYPDLHEDPLADVYIMMQRSKRAMRLANVDIPHVVILQTWILPPKNKLPEIDELRVMAYQVMLGGAEVLSFFEYKPEVWDDTPGFTEGFEALIKELVQLRRKLTGAEIETHLDEDFILHAKATWNEGTVANIRVNTNRFESAGLQPLAIEDDELEAIDLQKPDTLLAEQGTTRHAIDCTPDCVVVSPHPSFSVGMAACGGTQPKYCDFPGRTCTKRRVRHTRLKCHRNGILARLFQRR